MWNGHVYFTVIYEIRSKSKWNRKNTHARVWWCANFLTDHTHTCTRSKPKLAVFTVLPCVFLWWDTQADNTGPKIPSGCVWSRAEEAGHAWVTGQMEEFGQRVVLCAWLRTRWGTHDLLAGQLWPLPQTQQAPDAVLRFLRKHSGMKGVAVYAKRNGPLPL